MENASIGERNIIAEFAESIILRTNTALFRCSRKENSISRPKGKAAIIRIREVPVDLAYSARRTELRISVTEVHESHFRLGITFHLFTSKLKILVGARMLAPHS